ncbi:MAG TPA: triphosphoribosyl-dephospho-CoA synthase [Planctomycetaceae bacterium]|jgi:triphosphoribosyl-dephospho-CoA synthase|nr:triphosphoribosyl-dephospho-CoA synthase [Planctomycetaceae bacterium]
MTSELPMSPTSLAEHIELACLMEATARKPGNVHPGASFVDLCYDDFVQAAASIAPVIAEATPLTIGRTVLSAIEATQQHARSNINLGIVLLMTPLAALSPGEPVSALHTILEGTTWRDAADVYRAIRLAMPGGIGKVDDQDVAEEPTQTLREVMRLAADRDLIAAQYANGFAEVRSLAARIRKLAEQPAAAAIDRAIPPWEQVVIAAFLQLLSEHPDSLIVRKAGLTVAQEARQRAAVVIHAGWPFTPESHTLFDELDLWLRANGHCRNPGTSADLIAAALFVALREGWLTPPTKAELITHAAAIRRARD